MIRKNVKRFSEKIMPKQGDSKHLEIFAMLPVRHFGLEALDLRLLDVHVVIDEAGAERFAEEWIGVECGDSLLQRFRQKICLGLVRRIGGRAGIKLAVDAVEA